MGLCRYAAAHSEEDVIGKLRVALLERAEALIESSRNASVDGGNGEEGSVATRMASFLANVKGEQKQPGLTWEPELFALPTPSKLLKEGSAALRELETVVSAGSGHSLEAHSVEAQFVPAGQDLVVPGRVVLLRRSHVGDDEQEAEEEKQEHAHALGDTESPPPTHQQQPSRGEAKGYVCGGLAPTLRRFELSRSMAEDHLMDRYLEIIAELYAKYR